VPKSVLERQAIGNGLRRGRQTQSFKGIETISLSGSNPDNA
jgi:hypothetical protein